MSERGGEGREARKKRTSKKEGEEEGRKEMFSEVDGWRVGMTGEGRRKEEKKRKRGEIKEREGRDAVRREGKTGGREVRGEEGRQD